MGQQLEAPPTERDDGSSFVARPATAPRSRSPWPIHAALAVAIVLLLAGSAFAYDLHRFQETYDGRILPGATIGSVDLSGMDRTEAIAALEADVAPRLDRRVTLRWEDHGWDTSMRDLGATTDIDEQVDRVLATSDATNWITMAGVRWRGDEVPQSGDVAIDLPRASVAELVRGVSHEVDLAAVDAELHYNSQRVWVDPHQVGRRVVPIDTTDALFEALGDPDGPSEIPATVVPVEPEVRTEAFAQVLFLRQRDHRLDLYLDGQMAHSYVVATGTNDYPTPTGTFEVTLKRYLPTWVNPDPGGWGRTMPARIGPGPNNPLGVRALNWSAPGAIRFHGTAALDSLGTDASHGCVRLSNADIVHLYDRVDEGATIVSIR